MLITCSRHVNFTLETKWANLNFDTEYLIEPYSQGQGKTKADEDDIAMVVRVMKMMMLMTMMRMLMKTMMKMMITAQQMLVRPRLRSQNARLS